MDLENIKGIGPKTLELLHKLNINNISDLIRYYPYRYNVYSPQILPKEDTNNTIIINAKIASVPKISYIKKNFNKISFMAEANNNIINVTIFNRAYLKNNLIPGKYITLIGKYNILKNTFTCSDIRLTPLLKTEVEPVYHMIKGLKISILTKCIKNVLNNNIEDIELLPEYINEKYNFIKEIDAIKEIHFPTLSNNLKKALLKLKYDELFEFMFKINLLKFKNHLMEDFVVKEINDKTINDIKKIIPFELTNDQLDAVNDIIKDFRSSKRMNRLLLGDVGSGKTIVAFIAIILNYYAGYQSALLAPTEVLAKQHYENFNKLFSNINIKCALITGSTSKKNKNKLLEQLRNNEIDILIGTHAILEDNVEFNNIGLVITDEQHRFGVNQRKSLQNKGRAVDVLYMSATPIPRTYALTIYGDMDISMIKNKPKGRKPITTTIISNDNINEVIYQIKTEVDNHHQVYVIAPLIEENETSNLNDINKIKEIISCELSDKSIDILHGKMKNNQKEEIMNKFKEGKTDILISTTVIEVGVDVANATMMVIFNAERFGLATLHQLRGRVGRSSLESKCILISNSENERLKVLCESNDGFYIAEQDFKLRGSGDLFGIRQSGDMQFKIADLNKDFKILLQCKIDTEEFINNNIENNFVNYPHYQSILTELMNND